MAASGRLRYGMLCATVLSIVFAPAAPAQDRATRTLEKVDFEQKLGAQVPLDLGFVDEQGRAVTLSRYFNQKPVVLALVYYECPMLCTLVLQGLVDGLKKVPHHVGDAYDVVVVSIDPQETSELAAQKKLRVVEAYGRPQTASGWHFLTGEEPRIRALADAVGFHYVKDEKSGEYAHAAGVMVLTSRGVVSRYFYGIQYEGRDLRMGIIDASGGKVGSAVERLILRCYHYDPETGQYSLAVMGVLRVAGLVTVLTLGAVILLLMRKGASGGVAGATPAPRPQGH